MILLVLILSFVIYFYSQYNKYEEMNLKEYKRNYDYCIKNMNNGVLEKEMSHAPPNYYKKSYDSCISNNGCFITCGSGCGLPPRNYNLKHFFDDYFSSGACNAVCTMGCVYPTE